MSDLSDVENLLISTLTQIIYPNGTANPSIINANCRIFRGWPIPAQLDADLAAGIIDISLYPQEQDQRTTRYPKDWQQANVPTPTLTLTVSGTMIIVGGTPTSPLNAAAIVNNIGYVYPVQATDTVNTIATGLAALINVNTPATSSGPVITIPAATEMSATVGTIGTIVRETRRQKRKFQINCWCPTPAVRDSIGAAIDEAFADIDFLTMPDGISARVLYESSMVVDNLERQGLYRRYMNYSVEYATSDTQTTPQVVAQTVNLTGGLDPNAPPVKSFTI